MPRSTRLSGGGRFHLSVSGDPPVVTKRGPADAVAREAEALDLLADTSLAPGLLGHTPDTVTMTFVDGTVRALADLSPTDAELLGATVRRVHDVRHADVGGRHVWMRPVTTLEGYARARVADLDPVPADLRDLADSAAGHLLRSIPLLPTPFRLLHGDLFGDNVLWTPTPVLVDWEFWRMGDPAEDLAYLTVMNDLPDTVVRSVLTGYGDTGMDVRLRAWSAATALDAGLWYRRIGDTCAGDRMIARARAALAA